MYNNSYEEYMRTVLGYVPNTNCMQCDFQCNQDDHYIVPENLIDNSNLEKMYPEIYRKVYPLVCKECMNNNMQLTDEILETMVDRIENSIELDLKVNTNVKVINGKRDDRIEDRQYKQNKSLLRDLIKILILRELLQQNRPPYPGGPVRPPMPGPRPPYPGGPIRPRDF